jgi:hypothetical protein
MPNKKNQDFMSSFRWHSCIGLDHLFRGGEQDVRSLPVSSNYVKKMFVAAGRGAGNRGLLIHRTKRCLWKMSKDNSYIEPVCHSDVLTLDDLQGEETTMNI